MAQSILYNKYQKNFHLQTNPIINTINDKDNNDNNSNNNRNRKK